jgi:hypothetical protein
VRYYKIIVQNADGSVITPPGFAGLLGGATYSSYVNGQTLPGAWNVELDIPAIDAATSQGFASATVWGVSDQEIAQANDLTGKAISIFGGMQKGLPLANPKESGLLTSGTVLQCFGNNIGVDRTLDFVISPGPPIGTNNSGGIGTIAKPKNLVLNWPAGQPLGVALQSCLSVGFPNYTINVAISSSLVRSNTEAGFFPTLEQLAQFCRETSFDIIRDTNYEGVSIVPSGATISAFDNSQSKTGTNTGTTGSKTAVTAIAFQDLIGQPTWIQSPNIQFKTVMRADLAIQSSITLPQTRIINTSNAASNLSNQKLTFQGGFSIISMRHVGHFRQPSADSWVTVFEAAPNQLVGLSPEFNPNTSAGAVF